MDLLENPKNNDLIQAERLDFLIGSCIFEGVEVKLNPEDLKKEKTPSPLGVYSLILQIQKSIRHNFIETSQKPSSLSSQAPVNRPGPERSRSSSPPLNSATYYCTQ